MHAIAAQVEISKIEAKVDIITGKKLPFGFLKAGEKGICQLKVIIFLFRLKDLFAWKNLNLCQVWEDLLSEMRESKS